MKDDSNITNWLEIGEFRKELKKVVIPYNKFFKKFNYYNNYEEKIESFSFTLKS